MESELSLEIEKLVDNDRGISYGVVQPGSNIIDGIPIIRVNNLKNGTIDTRQILRIDKEIEKKYSRTRLHGGEVILSIVGDVGRSAVVTDSIKNWNVARAIAVIPVTKVEPYWLHLCLQTNEIQRIMNNWCNTTVQYTLNLKDLAKIRIPVFQEHRRRKIISIIQGLDLQIQNSEKINSVLEKIIQTIFKSWFVDFDGQTEFVDSELGQIPNGWRVEKLSSSVELLYGKSLTSKTRIEGHVPVFGSSGIVGYHNESIVPGPGIIVGRKGNVGSIFWSDSDFYPIDTVYYVKSKLPLEFVYYLLKTLNFINSDSSVPGLSREQAYSLTILIPHNSLLSKFTRVVNSFFHLKTINEKQIKILSNTRDSLLPKLMSGEIRV